MENKDKVETTAIVDRKTALKIAEDEPEKMGKVVTFLMLGFPIPEAGQLAGYSESYSTSGLYSAVKNDPRIHKLMLDRVENLPATYKRFAMALLPQIADLERKIIEHVSKNLTDYPKFKQAIKELKQSANVLQVEGTETNINIFAKEIQNLAAIAHQTHGKCLPDPEEYKEVKDK